MSSILRTAASGLAAQQRALDIISNNIANVSTTGFKKSRAVFADAKYYSEAASTTPLGEPVPAFTSGSGVTMAATQRILSAGNFQETGSPLDLTIAGNGFFQVALPDGTRAYTRDGSFTIDAQGQLTTTQGYLVDPPITFPAGAQNVQIDQNGAVQAEVNGQPTQIGTINVATFPTPEGLLAAGGNLYTVSDASGQPQVGAPGAGGAGQLVSGVLETSNVDLADEMTRAIEAQRAYQLNIKVMQTADEMIGLATNIRR
jgi:flagellar basal-body rod protein FlgG